MSLSGVLCEVGVNEVNDVQSNWSSEDAWKRVLMKMIIVLNFMRSEVRFRRLPLGWRG